MTTCNDPTDPPKKTKNEQKLNNLLGDIRYALMDYQVCTPKRFGLDVSDIYLRLHCSEKSTIKTASR